MAITVINIEEAMFISPPLVSRLFTASMSEFIVKPFLAITNISPKFTP